MGRRKTKKVRYRPIKKLPKIFQCPKCGKKTLKTKIDKENGKALVICGSCGTEQEVKANILTEPVDAYADFIDIYYADREYERLMKRIDYLDSKGNYSELVKVYLLMADICKINAEKAEEEFRKTKSAEDEHNAKVWDEQARQYRELARILREKLESGEIADRTSEDEDPELKIAEGAPARAKRARTLEEIVGSADFFDED